MTILYIIYAIIMFCLLIFVHELGHFLAAKSCGVKVNEFALGMGPAFFKRQRGETKYSLRAVPIGGYCAMEGEDEDSDNPRAFNSKPAWKRAIVLAAGSFMNWLLCILLLIIVALFAGSATTTIDKTEPGSPAQHAGIKAGDQIRTINGSVIGQWTDVTTAIGTGDKTKQVTVKVSRDGKDMTFVMDTMKSGDGRQIIGITPALTHNPFIAAKTGVTGTWNMAKMMGSALKQLFSGQASMKQLSGPVGIVYAVTATAKTGFGNLLVLTAFISLNLGIVNMLPWPALDGGRLIFLLIRKITGKAITAEMEGKIHFAGIIILFGLMIYVTWNDITRLVGG